MNPHKTKLFCAKKVASRLSNCDHVESQIAGNAVKYLAAFAVWPSWRHCRNRIKNGVETSNGKIQWEVRSIGPMVDCPV
jgi:diaminopimelate epimerase